MAPDFSTSLTFSNMKNSTKSCVSLNVKTFLLPLILSTLVKLSPSHAQQGAWTPQFAGTNCNINAVHFTEYCCTSGESDVLGWFVGWCLSSGVLQTSGDGGESWNSPGFIAQPNPNQSLYDVHFIEYNDTAVGWVVGTNGHITRITMTELSYTSQPQSSGVSQRLESVFFVDKDNGWATGQTNGLQATIIHTSDGGENWESQGMGLTFPIAPDRFTSIHFADVLNGWVVGLNGRIFGTTNGGAGWTLRNSGTEVTLNDVFFIDASIGWAVGYDGLILKSIDGGVNWQSQTSGTSNMLRSVHFTDPSKGWAVGNSGVILHTIDGGATWTPQSSGTSEALRSVFFINETLGWAVGQGKVLRYMATTASNDDFSAVETGCRTYPNPFGQSTWIEFTLGTGQHVSLDVTDMLGRHVTTLTNTYLASGTHRFKFEGESLSEGIYIYRLQTASGSAVGQLILEH